MNLSLSLSLGQMRETQYKEQKARDDNGGPEDQDVPVSHARGMAEILLQDTDVGATRNGGGACRK